MLLFSTILDIDESMNEDTFIKLVINWNNESTYEANRVPGLKWNGEYTFEAGSENLKIKTQEYPEEKIIAVRHEKKDENGVVWDTDFIMNFKTMKMAIQLDRSYSLDAPDFDPRFSTPHFITLLIEGGHLKDDEDLPVSKAPVEITDQNLNVLADIINEESSYKLPVVFISKTDLDEEPVDVSFLGSKLKGVAHVLVLGSKRYNNKLEKLTDGYNEESGEIGIYYPGGSKKPERYFYREESGHDHFLFNRVFRKVIENSLIQKIDDLYTWDGVTNALSNDRLYRQYVKRIEAEESLKAAEEKNQKILEELKEEQNEAFKDIEAEREESKALVASCNDEIEILKQIRDDLAAEINHLKSENEGFNQKIYEEDRKPILVYGSVQETYSGEIRDLILDLLSKALKKKIGINTRRADVVSDIIKSNDN